MVRSSYGSVLWRARGQAWAETGAHFGLYGRVVRIAVAGHDMSVFSVPPWALLALTVNRLFPFDLFHLGHMVLFRVPFIRRRNESVLVHGLHDAGRCV